MPTHKHPSAPGAIAFCEGARVLPVTGVRGGNDFSAQDWVADEVPVALEYNGVQHAVMLASPLDLTEVALGFSLSGGILSYVSEGVWRRKTGIWPGHHPATVDRCRRICALSKSAAAP